MRVLVAHQHLALVVVSDFSHSKRGVVVCHCYFNLQFPNDVWLRTCVHAQLCLTLCDPSDCSPPGSFVHGISQARVLEWVAISYSRGSSGPRDLGLASLVSSALGGGLFTTEPSGKPHDVWCWVSFHMLICTRVYISFWRRKWQPTPVFLPGESQGRGSLVGCRLWGRTESDTTEAT